MPICSIKLDPFSYPNQLNVDRREEILKMAKEDLRETLQCIEIGNGVLTKELQQLEE